MEAAPRTRICNSDPGAPLVDRTSTPANCPCNEEARLGAGRSSSFAASTLAMAPVTFPLLAVP